MSKFSRFWQYVKPRIPTFQKGSQARKTLIEFSVIYCGVFFFTSNIYGFTMCVGPSMLPTIDTEGEFVIIEKFPYVFNLKDYKIGDVVISRSMDDPSKSKFNCL